MDACKGISHDINPLSQVKLSKSYKSVLLTRVWLISSPI